uniref:KRAB domain-containing protein n=1 Tax=Peromyscus maniculatus bairdii TaxID=230844 RepID=A0A8C9CTW5_PERMB
MDGTRKYHPDEDAGVQEPEVGSVSFEDISLDFTWDEWQDLDSAQRTLYRDVMLENYSSLMFLGHCTTKPEMIFKLEHGFGPWSLAEVYPEPSRGRGPKPEQWVQEDVGRKVDLPEKCS